MMMSSIVKKMWCCGAATASDVPKGRVRIRVGRHGDVLCKFDVEASHLNHPLFENLLRLSEEEFGFSYDGPLRIACEIDMFRCLLRLLNASHRHPPVRYRALSDLASKLSADDDRSKFSLPSR